MASRLPPEPLLDLLTRPREAGTPDAAAARDTVAAYLESLGYTVERQAFGFHPSALWAFPILGAGLGWLALVLLPLLTLGRAPAWGALAVWAFGAASLAALCVGVGTGAAALPFGGGPREDANLIATRSSNVRAWIVAHLDTKAQGHSMAGRLIAVWVVAAAGVVLTGLSLARLGGPVVLPVGLGGVVLGVAAGALAGRGRLAGQSPGARDNGSGVVAALVAAAEVDPDVGVIITGAEEFGLVGARVLAHEHPELFVGRPVLNFDTLDQTGTLYVVSHDVHGDVAANAGSAAWAGLGIPVRARRLPTGILVDSLPFARAGAVAITLARLDWSTLRLIHTPSDSGAGFSFDTSARLGRAAADVI